MNHIKEILSGIGILIAVYLVLSKGDATRKLINSVIDGATKGIKVLQGR